MNRTIVMRRLDELGHAALHGTGGEGGADLGVERDEVVDVGRLVAAPAEALDRGLEEARDAREVERAVEEPGDGDLVGGDQRGRRARPVRPGLAGDPERREARLVRARGSRAAPRRRGRAGSPGDGRRSG